MFAKVKMPRWGGIIANENPRFRMLIAVMLVVLSAALPFMQLGFLGVYLDEAHQCYIMTLLAPVTIAALLFGMRGGLLVGLFAGAMQLVHATLQPLDLNEMYFVSSSSSVLLFSLTGLLMGLFFRVALRNQPTGTRRRVYMALACLAGCTLHHLLFLVMAVVHVVMLSAVEIITTSLDHPQIPSHLLRAFYSTGSPFLQMLLDYLLMVLSCLAGDISSRRYILTCKSQGISDTFRGWLLTLVLLAFMVVSSLGFVVTTVRAKDAAHEQILGEADYLSNQIALRLHHVPDFERIVTGYGLSDPDAEELYGAIRGNELIDGYTPEEDGTVVVFSLDDDGDYTAVLSDDPSFPVHTKLTGVFGPTALTMFEELATSGSMAQSSYDFNVFNVDMETGDVEGDFVMHTAQIGYMCVCKPADSYYVMIMRPSSMVFANRTRTIMWMSILAISILSVVYILTSRLLDLVVVSNIDKTNESLARITGGNLQERVEVDRPREFKSLSNGINETVSALKGWIDEAERRNEQELATARAIQGGALPRTFPPFPEIDAFDIFASMDAAKEVGGDFYDFFLIDDHTLGFLIADVSGKGIPGALFMMAAKTEIENYMSTGMDVSQAIASANARLCANNDAGMFVTVWAATLDWLTGELTYVNAGHNFPLLRHGFNGSWEWLKKKCGLFLGTFDTAKYKQFTITLEPGDELLLYTDGVNEAFSIDEEEYGNDRLEAFVASHGELHPREMVRLLRSDVAAWASGAEQSDDITILALEYGTAPEVTSTITVPATLDYLEAAVSLVDNELEQRLCPIDVRHKVETAIEELFVNVCRYAYPNSDQPGDVRVRYAYSANPSTILVELVDHGIPFDPLTLEDPTKPSSIQEAKVGGLGIFMVKRTMDDFSYVYDAGKNIVAFCKRW